MKSRYAVAALLIAAASVYGKPKKLVSFVFFVSLACVVYWPAFTPLIRLHRFGKSGDFYYGTHLYGWPVDQLLVWFAGPKLSPL